MPSCVAEGFAGVGVVFGTASCSSVAVVSAAIASAAAAAAATPLLFPLLYTCSCCLIKQMGERWKWVYSSCVLLSIT
jgi:high-affinity nickel permease